MEYTEKINLFVSYSHQDKKKPAFQTLLKCLNSGRIAEKTHTWTDVEIELGEKWNSIIKQNLANADIVLLVLSEDFLGSDYIKNTELKLALERSKRGECEVIPLFFRYCDWKGAGFEDSQGFPTDKKYQSGEIKVITDMEGPERDYAFTIFKQKINDLCDKIINRRKEISPMSANSNETASAKKNNQDLSTLNQQSQRANQPKLIKNDCKFYAIIIVNYNYEFMPEKNIPNIEANLNSLQEIFINDFKIPNENIKILPNKSSADLLENLVNIIEGLQEDTTLFVYYSGHGIPDSDDFFWATKNTKLKENKNEINTGTAYETSKMRKLLERSGLKQKILVVDCCYAAEFLAGAQSMTIDGYMQQKVNISDTFYFFSSEAGKESMFPVHEPKEATYFTQALVKAFKDEIIEGNSDIKIGNIYKRTDAILSQFRRKDNNIPSPIKQPKDNSLDNIILFSNPNKPSKSAIESQTNRASETPDNVNSSNIVEEAFSQVGQALIKRYEKADLSEEERKDITKQNFELIAIIGKHREINKIQNDNERTLRSAELAISASKFPSITIALMKQSQIESIRSADKSKNTSQNSTP